MKFLDVELGLFPTGHEYLLEIFPNYDYHNPYEPDRLDYSRADNIVGYQQRAFMVYWALCKCGRTGRVGLDIGSGGIMTPYCLSTDKTVSGIHPTYGGEYAHSQLKLEGEDLSLIGEGTIPLIIGNHIMEHLKGNVVDVLNEQWIPKLEPGGMIAQIIPDNRYVDVLSIDKSHKQAWTPKEFELKVIRKLKDVELVEIDTLKNRFSFDVILVKKG